MSTETEEVKKATQLGRFEVPNRLVKNEDTATDVYAQFVAEPFERGYGHTLGNSLRRVLLGSLEGASITSVRIAGVQHEFSCSILFVVYASVHCMYCYCATVSGVC